MYTVIADLTEFRAAAARTQNELVRAAYDAARAGAEAGRDEAKRVGRFEDQSGRLRGTIAARHADLTEGGGVWEIVAPAPYALFVEGGTRPHPIVARTGPALSFYWKREGRWFHGRRVNHPGTRPYPFMGPAYERAEAVAMARIEAAIARISAEWG